LQKLDPVGLSSPAQKPLLKPPAGSLPTLDILQPEPPAVNLFIKKLASIEPLYPALQARLTGLSLDGSQVVA